MARPSERRSGSRQSRRQDNDGRGHEENRPPAKPLTYRRESAVPSAVLVSGATGERGGTPQRGAESGCHGPGRAPVPEHQAAKEASIAAGPSRPVLHFGNGLRKRRQREVTRAIAPPYPAVRVLRQGIVHLLRDGRLSPSVLEGVPERVECLALVLDADRLSARAAPSTRGLEIRAKAAIHRGCVKTPRVAYLLYTV